MASTQGTKLFKIASQINIGRDAIVEYLVSKGFPVENRATTVLTDEMVEIVSDKFTKELKTAEKQREKMQRQQQVRKTLHEQGNAVSIESLTTHHEEAAPAAPAQAQPEPSRPAEMAEAASQGVSPQPPAVEARAVEPPPAVRQDPPADVQPAYVEPPAAIQQPPAVEARAVEPPPAVPSEPAADASASTSDSGPSVGEKVDLAAVRRSAKGGNSGWTEKDLKKGYVSQQPQPPTRQSEPAPVVEAPAPAAQPEPKAPEQPRMAAEQPAGSVAPQAQAAAPSRPDSPATPQSQQPREDRPRSANPPAATGGAPAKTGDKPTGDAKPAGDKPADAQAGEEEKRGKRPRKNVIEVEYKAGQGVQLKGLTVIGKIDLTPKPEVRPKRDRNDRGPGANNRGPGGNRPGGPGGNRPGGPGGNRPGGPGGNRPGGPGGNRPGGRDGGRATIGDAVNARGTQRPGGPGSTSTSTTPNFGPDKKKGGSLINKKRDDKKKKGAKGGVSQERFSDSDVTKAIRATLSGMEDTGSGSKSRAKKARRMVREERAAARQEEMDRQSSILKLSEFVTTADLANMMRVSASDIIMKCMSLGLMVSINQRLDRETIILITSDYGFEVEFVDDQASQEVDDMADAPEALKSRPPIVTIMGHVDHGKTSLLDYIRNANVVAGEAGGITQHIGAYSVTTASNRKITFLDTPGHEAFTAMRARGAQVTDIVVLVVAADDSVMPQTIEAISHAQAANVPIVVAINKVDRAEANPDRIRQQLADHGVLVEEWGGKYQAVELSAKTGLNIDQLLEKILLEADILELKADPDRAARCTVIEAHVDKGRGNVVTVMVQKGTLNVGDIFVCGQFAGRVRAMFDERGNRLESAGPAEPALVTGFDGLPNAGDILVEMETDSEAREVATRRQQLRREQQFRGMRHMTLDDISAQIQQGGVKDLRLIVKADVSGSVEALSDALQKLGSSEVKVVILLKSVGAITESDIMLASASDAVIVGFQTNISPAARKLAETESVDVRLYSIIYDCINEVQLALEGMLTPDIKEEITSSVEVRATFKISKLGTIAGCMVQSGKIIRNDRIRILRDGFEIFKGTLASLKRVKDDVREVDAGYECGIGVNGFNDLEVGDIIESYKTIEVKRKLGAA